MVKPIFDPATEGVMRIAGFMSGSGTNLVKILEHERELARRDKSPYEVVVIFTDNEGSNARSVGQNFSVPVVTRDIMAFYRDRGHDTKKNLSLRLEFDRLTLEELKPYRVHAIALCGYMSIVTEPLLGGFPGRIINVHPADLSIREDGKRKYTGDHAVRDAILAGERMLHSSTHIVRSQVDYGETLVISRPLAVKLPEGLRLEELGLPRNRARLAEIAQAHQDRLKGVGDWMIFPLTLEMIARGRFGVNEAGIVHLDGKRIPDGYRL